MAVCREFRGALRGATYDESTICFDTMVIDIKIGWALRKLEHEATRPATQAHRAQMIRALKAADRRIDRDVPMSYESRLVCESRSRMIWMLHASLHD
jgi:hypothetical protein